MEFYYSFLISKLLKTLINSPHFMNKKNILKSLPLILMIFLFSSCITIERNIKINEDGSGKETYSITYAKSYLKYIIGVYSSLDSAKDKSIIDSLYNKEKISKDINEIYKKIDGISLKEVKITTNPDSSITSKVICTFNNAEIYLKGFTTIENGQDALGSCKLDVSYKKDGKKIYFIYKYKIDSLDSNRSMRNSLSAFFKDQKITFNITFPHTIKSSNANRINGKTLTWEYDMETFITGENPIDIKVEMKK
jgi:hypothetical protein